MKAIHILSLIIALAAGAAVAGMGCANIPGDSCTNQSDCGTTMYCELSMPDGYCTLQTCEQRGCPDGGVCVRFDLDTSFCMAICSTNQDCRGGYKCVTDYPPHPYCGDARGESPISIDPGE